MAGSPEKLWKRGYNKWDTWLKKIQSLKQHMFSDK